MRITLLLLLAYSFNALAQPFHPSDSIVFKSDEIPRIDISIHPDSLTEILANTDSYYEYKAQFIFTRSDFADTLKNVGFRLRGNTSRQSDKKSFKVSFNSFKSDKDFFGLQKMNLNGEHNDPSIIRSFLSWELSESMQLISSRSNHVDLYINGDYYGLYINVEHIDDRFIKTRFGHELGNLYKCLSPANLDFLGENRAAYENNGYELKFANDDSGFTDLIELTKLLQETQAEELPRKLEPIFNVNGFIRYLAIETYTGHWDAYSFGKNNYYLFKNKLTGKFEFIPYDMDNTFGIDWYGIDWATRDIYNWWNDWELRPLTEKIMANSEYRNRYSFFLNQIISEHAKLDSFLAMIDEVKQKIEPSAQSDEYRTKDHGWDFKDFQNSYEEALGRHVTYGLKPFIKKRTETIQAQLELNDIKPIIERVNHAYNYKTQQVSITAQISDEHVPEVYITWQLNNETAVKEKLESATSNYLFVLGELNNSGKLSYYIEAIDENGGITREPISGNYYCKYGTSETTLRINEFLASNTESVFDNYGQSEDYIELYNYGTETILLGDKYLTDNANNPLKWQLPNVSLLPNDFLVIWADDDSKQGDYHANFKLSKTGEFIGLFDSADKGFLPIDSLSYLEQDSDVSTGRIDGDNIEQTILTPGGENNSESVAYITYAYDITDLLHAREFDAEQDYLEIESSNIETNKELFDNNEDGLIRASFFGFSADQQVAYKALLHGNACEEKHQVELQSGHNYFEHQLSILSSLSNNSIAGVLVYPNPVLNKALYISNDVGISSYIIYNALGHEVLNGEISSALQKVDVSALASGFYTISLYNNSIVGSQLLIVY